LRLGWAASADRGPGAGRLTGDELGERTGQVYASRTSAELAAVAADLPARLTPRPPAVRDVWTGVGLVVAAVSVLATIVLLNPGNALAFLAAVGAAATILLVPGITVGLMADVRHQRLSGREAGCGDPPVVAAEPPPPETARAIPTTAATTSTPAPDTTARIRRRLRRASSARIWAIFSRAWCLFRLPLDTATSPHGPVTGRSQLAP
jgi:hypothetical protein